MVAGAAAPREPQPDEGFVAARYAQPTVRRGESQRVLPRLLAVATDVPLCSGDLLRPAAEAESRELLAFCRYSLHAMAGERDEAGAALREVLAPDPRNPYYLWVAYGRQ